MRSTLNVTSTAVGLESGVIVDGSSSSEPASYNTVCFLKTVYGRDICKLEVLEITYCTAVPLLMEN